MSDSGSGPSPAPAIEARGVGKDYRLGEHQSLTHTLNVVARRASPVEPFRAVEDVSFRVQEGECFGLLGGNGSGKSTILQMIAGITLPTRGELQVEGRVLPLLRIGAGFHPELTGRENIILFGTILGLDRATILDSIDRVAEFAELESHLDTPNKRYSDGMQARLSFGIATLFPAHVYLFDEVLAVVDAEFRERCLYVIGRLVDAGRSVVFVSHDPEQVAAICTRGIWLDHGQVRASGDIAQVAEEYARTIEHPVTV